MQKKLSNELVDQYIRVGTGPALHSDQQEIKQTLVTNPQLRIQILSPSRILVAKQTLQTVKKDRLGCPSVQQHQERHRIAGS